MDIYYIILRGRALEKTRWLALPWPVAPPLSRHGALWPPRSRRLDVGSDQFFHRFWRDEGDKLLFLLKSRSSVLWLYGCNIFRWRRKDMFFLLRPKKTVGTLKERRCFQTRKKGDQVDNFQKQGKSLEFSALHRWLKICWMNWSTRQKTRHL